MAVSNAAGAELTVEWYIDPNLMSDLFENLFEIPSEIGQIITKDYRSIFGKHKKSIQKQLNKIKYKHCLYERDLSTFLKRGGDLVALAKSGPLCIASCMHFYKDEPLFRRFTPAPAICEEVDTIMAGDSTIIGMHIRRSDHKQAIRRSPLELFENAMDMEIELDSDVKFFLATDSAETEAHLRQLYGERIIVHKKSSLDRNNVAAIRDAMVDLYCLSKTKKIIGSFASSFSEVAAQISGLELVILDKAQT